MSKNGHVSFGFPPPVYLRLATVFACALFLSACTHAGLGRDQPVPAELTTVPFYPQEAFQCGPAALAAVLGAAGVNVQPEHLLAEVYLPARRGSLQIELMSTARRYDRVPFVLAPSRAALQAELAVGNPVLVLQNLAFAWYPKWHYAVIVGMDPRRDEVILRSGRERRHVVRWSVFERTWDRAGRWAIVITAPDRLPATAQEIPYLHAVAVFERRAQWHVVRRAYTAALARWPRSLGAHVGLGNARYGSGDLAGAERILRAATQAHPGAAVAFNNLAFVLAEQGNLDAAQEAARKAVALGGGQAVYRETLTQIQARLCLSESCPDAVPHR